MRSRGRAQGLVRPVQGDGADVQAPVGRDRGCRSQDRLRVGTSEPVHPPTLALYPCAEAVSAAAARHFAGSSVRLTCLSPASLARQLNVNLNVDGVEDSGSCKPRFLLFKVSPVRPSSRRNETIAVESRRGRKCFAACGKWLADSRGCGGVGWLRAGWSGAEAGGRGGWRQRAAPGAAHQAALPAAAER